MIIPKILRLMRTSPIDIEKEEFRKIGYKLIDEIANFIGDIDSKPVTKGLTPSEVQNKLGMQSLPELGSSASELISEATELLLNNSLLNGHPKFLGYITSSATPIGALADLLAASVNPNVGAYLLSPIATEIEKQTIQWLAEFIGVSSSHGGILVSGGNMANFTAFLAGRTAMSPDTLKSEGLLSVEKKQTVYCSKTTHTWVEKAAILFGLGSNALRWIPADSHNKMRIDLLQESIETDLENGYSPMMVIGTAGDVSTGAVDDLDKINAICKTYDLWFHVDGAYGIPAAVIPSLNSIFKGIEHADSIALDPHKWLYSPLEAGCTLVKDPKHLTDTFSSHPEYYNFSSKDGEFSQNFYEYGLQNSRGFRALKVWLGLKQLGRRGYEQLINEDIRLSALLYKLAAVHEELEAISNNLSITTLRYVPHTNHQSHFNDDYLNTLNKSLLESLQQEGEAFLSNAVIDGKYCLRGCIVNFRTSEKDIHEIIDIIVKEGKKAHEMLQNRVN